MTRRSTEEKVIEGTLRVWWIPQIPGPPVFHVPVGSVHEAALLMDTLAKYDLFQYNNRIKPDYSNAGGLEVFVKDKWEEWNDEEGRDIDEWMKEEWRHDLLSN